VKELNYSLIFGSFFGLTAVMLGAFGAHYLHTLFSTKQMSIYQTATTYQMYHAIILAAIGLVWSEKKNKILNYSIISFIIGILLFCGTLYLYLATNIVAFAILTPIGGLGLILGWALLLYYAIKAQ